jgi:hypothetical protein
VGGRNLIEEIQGALKVLDRFVSHVKLLLEVPSAPHGSRRRGLATAGRSALPGLRWDAVPDERVDRFVAQREAVLGQ